MLQLIYKLKYFIFLITYCYLKTANYITVKRQQTANVKGLLSRQLKGLLSRLKGFLENIKGFGAEVEMIPQRQPKRAFSRQPP